MARRSFTSRMCVKALAKATPSDVEQLANTRPTTIGGVAAVLAYWSEIASEDHLETDLGSTVTFMEALAEVVREIA
jgi:hypothetical protein